MKLLRTLLLTIALAALINAQTPKPTPIDKRAIPIIKQIKDISIIKGDRIQFSMGGYMGGANVKYEISKDHRPGEKDTKGVNIIQRIFESESSPIKMKDTAETCTIAKRISDTKFYVLCDKSTIHYVEFEVNKETKKITLKKDSCWSKKITKDSNIDSKIEKCYDIIEVDSRAIIVCKIAPDEQKPSKLLFSFVRKDTVTEFLVDQKKEQYYQTNLVMTAYSNNYLILRQRFAEGTPTLLHRSFKIWTLSTSSSTPLTSERFVDISKLKETSLAGAKDIGATIDIRNIEYVGGKIWISGTDYIAPPTPPKPAQTLGQIPTSKPHNVYKIFKFFIDKKNDVILVTPDMKGTLVIPFEKDEVIERSIIRVTPNQSSSEDMITIVTKTAYYKGTWKKTAGKTATDPETYEYIQEKKAAFLCGSNVENADKVHLSDIQLSADGRGLLVAVHHTSHEKSETVGLFDTNSFMYDCIDNSLKKEYEILTDYDTMILGSKGNMNFYDISEKPSVWFDYAGLSQNPSFVKGKPIEVTLTAKINIPKLVERKGEMKFKITVYDKWSSAATAKEPNGGAVTVFENSWIKLPFTPRVIRANNPEFKLFEGTTAVTDEKKMKIRYLKQHEVKLELTGLTGLPDQIFNADANTYVAVKYKPNEKGKYWVFDCDENKLTSKFECQKAPTSFDLDDKDQFITYTGRIDKFIFIIIGSKTTKKTYIRFVDDEKKTLHTEKFENDKVFDSPIFFNNKGYGYMIYLENDGSNTSGLQKDRYFKARSFYVDSNGKPVLSTYSTVYYPQGQTVCPQQIYYDSSNAPEKYRTIIIKSHCVGKKAEIIRHRLGEGLSSNSGNIPLNVKTMNYNGFSFCPAGSEGFMFSPFRRKLTTFSWLDDSTYDYNLFETGIAQPLLMNCVSEKNLAQIIGKDSTEGYILANFIGGNVNDPTRRIHSIVKLTQIPKTNTITGIASAFNPMTDKIATMISHTGEAATKRYLYEFHLDGPEVYYKVPAAGEKTLTLEAKSSATVVKSVLKLTSAPRKDAIELKVKGKVDINKKVINLDNHMELTGNIVAGKLVGPADVIGTKVVMSNNRKMPKHGFKSGTGVNYDKIDVRGKWMMGVIKGKQIDFFFNPTQANGGGTDISKIESFKGEIEDSVIVPHPTELSECLVVAKLINKEKRRIDWAFIRLYLDGTKTKVAKSFKYRDLIESEETFATSKFDVKYVSEKEVIIIEVGPGGSGFTITKYKRQNSISYGFTKIKDSSSKALKSITTDYKIKSFTTLWIKNYLVLVYISEGIDSIGYVVYTRGSNPIVSRTPIHDKEKFIPEDIQCIDDDKEVKSISCFIDVVGDKDILMKYTLGDMKLSSELFTKKEKLASYLSPPGFDAVKIDRTKTLTGILFKNTEVKKSAKKLLSGKNLKAGKTIYECDHVLSIYKPGSEYAYITFTCEDFGNPEKDVPVDFALETYDADYVWLSQYNKPATRRTLQAVQKASSIKAFSIGQFEITVKDGKPAPKTLTEDKFSLKAGSDIDWSKIKFEAVGNDGTSTGGSKSMNDFFEGEKKKEKSGGSFMMIFIIILVIILIVVAVVFVMKKKGGEQESGSYVSAPKENAKETGDMDDSVL